MSEINFIKFFIKEKRLFYRIISVGFIVSILVALLLPKLYKTSFSFFPNSASSSGLDSVKSVAVSIGLGVGGMGGSEGSYDLTNITHSDMIKRKIIRNKFKTVKNIDSLNLVKYWKIGEEGFSLNPIDYASDFFYWILSIPKDQKKNILWHEKLAMKKLSDRYIVNKNNLTGLITIHVWMEEPELSKNVAEFFISEINEYVSEIEYSNLSKQEGFVETRLFEIQNELTKNEEELKIFRENNRIISNPDLKLKEDRLKRDVYINTEVYVSLQQELELLKVRLVGQKDSIYLLDHPQLPAKKDKPKRVLIVLSGLALSIMFFISTIVIKHRESFFD